MQRFALQLVLPALALFGLTAALSSFAARTHRSRKAFVGSVGLVASVSMYTSPMVAAVSIYRSPNPLPPADFPLYFTASAGTKISGWSPTTPVDRYCRSESSRRRAWSSCRSPSRSSPSCPARSGWRTGCSAGTSSSRLAAKPSGSSGPVDSVCLLAFDPVGAVQSPNFIGVPVGVLQLLLYCIYRRDHGAAAGAEAHAHGPAAAADQEKGMKAAAPVAVQPQEVAARVSEYE